MTEDIRYQINGQLADNTVTADNTEDVILIPVSNGNADEKRIIAEMKAEDSGLREETIQHVFNLQKRVIKRMLMSGVSVNTGLYYASTGFRGTIDNSSWNAARNLNKTSETAYNKAFRRFFFFGGAEIGADLCTKALLHIKYFEYTVRCESYISVIQIKVRVRCILIKFQIGIGQLVIHISKLIF